MDDGPEAVLIRQELESNAIGGRLTRRRVISSYWHAVDIDRARTQCGLSFNSTKPRQPWFETPEEMRCRMCASRQPPP